MATNHNVAEGGVWQNQILPSPDPCAMHCRQNAGRKGHLHRLYAPNSSAAWGGQQTTYGEGLDLVYLPCLTQPPTKSYSIATTQQYKASKRSGRERQCKLVCQNRIVENAHSERKHPAYLLFGLLSACTQHSMKRVLRVIKLLNVLHEAKKP